ncbi:MAG: phosphoribosylanthranilate isomerase [Candidatus Bathyarchaeia archaeon]
MRVKICGLMRLSDVSAAVNEGADAVGFVVESPSSPRNLSLTKAQELMKAVKMFSTKVAVTSAHDPKRIVAMCAKLRPDALQLHYHTPELVHILRKKQSTSLILATGVRDTSSLKQVKSTSKYADAVLADSPSSTGMGGTGRTHNWELTARIRNAIHPHPLILAGGLTADNVKAAIEVVRPFAVDVSSGVEKTIGVKDHDKIRKFIMNAQESSS